MIDGEWVEHDLGPDAHGRFIRAAAKFRGRISADGKTGFKAEQGRYHLYIADACGWCHRTLLFRQLLGLEEVISVSRVEPLMGEQGWEFGDHGDPVLGKSRLSEVYTEHDPKYTGRVTVPTLWDRKTHRIVTNESSDIIRDFDSAFSGLLATPRRFFPPEIADEIDAMIDANYHPINNGVYRCGFAGSQQAYDEAISELFARLDALESLLDRQRYLLGERLTAADLCLFPTLYRFDSVYYIHFKCCVRQLRDYPNLWAYTRDIYQTPGVAKTCDMPSTRAHYYASHESIHPRRLVPSGPEVDFLAPHGREHVGTT